MSAPYSFVTKPISIENLEAKLKIKFALKPHLKHCLIEGIGNLETPCQAHLHYLDTPKMLDALMNFNFEDGPFFCLTQAKIIKPKRDYYQKKLGDNLIFLLCERPKKIWAQTAFLIYEDYPFIQTRSDAHYGKISETANYPACLAIDVLSDIGDNSRIGYHVSITNSRIGKNCLIGNNVSISHAAIGDNSHISSGAIIGEAGFGIVPAKGREKQPQEIPQLGAVKIGNNCLIGANSTVDRATIGKTILGDGTKIDNLVQIGHNVITGKNCLIAAGCLIGGSAKIGNGVMIAGASAIADNITLADNTVIAGNSVVIRDTQTAEHLWGIPARPHIKQKKINILLDQMLENRQNKRRNS